jgi:hypothetical protein
VVFHGAGEIGDELIHLCCRPVPSRGSARSGASPDRALLRASSSTSSTALDGLAQRRIEDLFLDLRVHVSSSQIFAAMAARVAFAPRRRIREARVLDEQVLDRDVVGVEELAGVLVAYSGMVRLRDRCQSDSGGSISRPKCRWRATPAMNSAAAALRLGRVGEDQPAAALGMALVHAHGSPACASSVRDAPSAEDGLAVAELVLDELHRVAVLRQAATASSPSGSTSASNRKPGSFSSEASASSVSPSAVGMRPMRVPTSRADRALLRPAPPAPRTATRRARRGDQQRDLAALDRAVAGAGSSDSAGDFVTSGFGRSARRRVQRGRQLPWPQGRPATFMAPVPPTALRHGGRMRSGIAGTVTLLSSSGRRSRCGTAHRRLALVEQRSPCV